MSTSTVRGEALSESFSNIDSGGFSASMIAGSQSLLQERLTPASVASAAAGDDTGLGASLNNC